LLDIQDRIMPAATAPVLLWFRQDLRLADNPALNRAFETGAPIIPIYILDDENAGDWAMGGASRFWLHHSLHALNKDLGGRLACYAGDAARIVPDLAAKTGARAVAWNRCYEPWRMKRDESIKKILKDSGIPVISENASLLYEPWQVKKDDGTPYRVFTPFFWRGCLGLGEPPHPEAPPKSLSFAPAPEGAGTIDSLNLLPCKIRWDRKMEAYWEIGEAGAKKRLDTFLKTGLKNYKDGRNAPAAPHVSRLSPHLHFGEISPRTVWHRIRQTMIAEGVEKDGDHFLSELGWREFSYSLLYFNHTLPIKPLQERFNLFPWVQDKSGLEAWKRGRTGYPIVDAGMRELWETGYMHNRVRMIVGSFLVKNLLIHWSEGETWFWDCLVDADLANNAASWQWIAGCGADAAPYFRIFNPVGQGEKFDADGAYVRRWCPELSAMPDDYIHRPWEASPMILKAAGVELGKTYPHPIVDHKMARDRALAAFQQTKGA
jgi:deoxyribodipyrimidine photo-lyase